jgi:hypothetical protein
LISVFLNGQAVATLIRGSLASPIGLGEFTTKGEALAAVSPIGMEPVMLSAISEEDAARLESVLIGDDATLRRGIEESKINAAHSADDLRHLQQIQALVESGASTMAIGSAFEDYLTESEKRRAAKE